MRQFCEFAAQACNFDLIWEREGDREVGVDRSTGKVLIKSEASWHRSNDIPYRLGDATRAREKLGWQPQTLAPELACLMAGAEFGALASERPRG